MSRNEKEPKRPTYRRALVTGASSGLGAEFARQLAAKGTHLVLVARRKEALEEVAREAAGYGVECRVFPCDLAEPAERRRLVAAFPELAFDLLVNNAGYGKLGAFAESPVEEQVGQVELNVKAVVELTHAALAAFLPKGRGAVVNVASTASFLPLPYFAVYAATKAFVRDFTHALREELAGSGVEIVCVSPGPTRTGFHERSGGKPFSETQMMRATECVREALTGLERGEAHVVTGLSNKALRVASGLLPRGLGLKLTSRAMARRTDAH